ncbi:Intraflagellar transport protein 56 [Chytriomyces hyalinus]|nr:Intraflagellar transport protein 56 [Chytriomyces hyalinus]
MRPPISILVDLANASNTCLTCDPVSQSLTVKTKDDSRIFQADQVFLQEADQSAAPALRAVIKPLVERFLGGVNVTLVLLGSSDSAKGQLFHSVSSKGSILPIFFESVFEQGLAMEPLKLELSALQIYGDLLRDLLDPSNAAIELVNDGFSVKANGITRRTISSSLIGLETLSMLGNPSSGQAALAATTEILTFEIERDVTLSTANMSTTERVRSSFTILKLLSSDLFTEEPNCLLLQEGPSVSHSVAVLASAINTVASAKGRFDFTQSNLTNALSQALGGNSLTAYLAFVKGDASAAQICNVLKLAQRMGRIKNNPVHLTASVRNLLQRAQDLTPVEERGQMDSDASKSYSSTQHTGAQIQNRDLKKDLSTLQAYVYEMTTKFNELKLANATLEACCKTTEKDRLAMKTELLEAKIELSRSLENMDGKNGDLYSQLRKSQDDMKAVETQLHDAKARCQLLEDQINKGAADREKLKHELDSEKKANAGLEKRLRVVEMKNKEIGLEMIAVLATKNNYDRHNESHKLELEKLRKHNEYLKKKMEINQKTSFSLGNEMERMLQREQEKLRKVTLEHNDLRSRIREADEKKKDAEDRLESFQEVSAAKEYALIQTHTSECEGYQSQMDAMKESMKKSQSHVEALRAEIEELGGKLNSAEREKEQLQQVIAHLEDQHSIATEHYRSKLEKLSQDVASAGNKKDAAAVSKQIFKEMLESYTFHEKQLQEELAHAKRSLAGKQQESGSNSSKIDQRDFHKKLKEFTMNIQYKLEVDRTSLLTRAIVAEELLKQHCICFASDAITRNCRDTACRKRVNTRQKKKVPKLDHFISARDYTGAITMLEFSKAIGKNDHEAQMWLGYTSFHLGDYRKSMQIYESMLQDANCDPLINLYLACCYFFLGMYKESDEAAQRGPTCKLQNRLLFHLSHKFNDEKRLMGYHQNLQDVIEDQLSLASIHYLRSHYQEAIDIYKRILLENRDFLAINVYVAMCYYNVSQEVLAVYLQHFPDSLIAINLKACNHFRLYNGKAAEAELNTISEKISPAFRFADDLIKHNLVVFRGGEGALQAFPSLLDVIPEARLNLVIFHLRNDDIIAAFNLMKDVEPSTPQEYILKGIVNATLGQDQESRDHLKIAQQYFQLVGGSASECDTIPGRQCMASCFFLLKQFDDVLIYLNSIKGYFYNDDTFNYNYSQAKVAAGAYEEAEDILLGNIERVVQFITACRERLWASFCTRPKRLTYWNDWIQTQTACIGILQQIISGEESKDCFRDIIALLRTTSNPQVEYILRIIKKVRQ